MNFNFIYFYLFICIRLTQFRLPFAAYGYGTLAVFIVCLCSIVAILFIPFANTVCLRTFDYVLGVFLGLAVGTLIADSILHLFPAVS